MIIETKDLNFGFSSKELILKNLNLKVEKGSIYGFLGPNGAGKTTTIRVLTGLLKSPRDSVKLFGKYLHDHKNDIFSKTGALIEQPSLYEHLSGYDNLEITRFIKKVKRSQIDKVLKLVNLTDASGKIVSTYSLGMKQRLGLAIALLSDPELLILDEPVNGLDPNGIIETRELLKTINTELGTTIFISSHLLSEIEKVVTHIGIINMGELLFQGTIDEILMLGKKLPTLRIETNDNKAAFQIIKNRFDIVVTGSKLKIACKSKNQIAEIVNELVLNNINVFEVTNETPALEELFIHITKNYKIS